MQYEDLGNSSRDFFYIKETKSDVHDYSDLFSSRDIEVGLDNFSILQLTISFGGLTFILYTESKCIQNWRHNDGEYDHGKEIKHDKIESSHWMHNHCVAIHNDEPIIHSCQFE